jgi:signal transduction histidine kinase
MSTKTEHLRTDFISMVSHELRSPLGTVKNVIEILLEGRAGEISGAQKHLLEVANKNIDRLIFLISDLLDVSNIELGKLSIKLAPVDIVEMLTDVLNTLESAVSEKKLFIKTNFAEVIPKISGDYQRLVEVFMNIIGNAIKFTTKGGITITLAEVEKCNSHKDRYVKITVSDTGCGISLKDMDKIFDKFYQIASSSSGLSKKGMGLGLTIAQKIVEMHHGKIEVESELGKGSVFNVFLPIMSCGE